MTSASSRRLRSTFVLLAVGFGLVAVSPVLRADSPVDDFARARELLNKGLDLRDAGELRAALDDIQAADVLAHTPITTMELGRTYVLLGRLVEAREVLASVRRLPERVEETDRSKAARLESERLADELKARIPTVMLRVRGVAPGPDSIMLDGAVVPGEALRGPWPVDPGRHNVTVRSSDGVIAEDPFELSEREARSIDLVFPPRDVAPRGPSPNPAPGPATRPAPMAPRPRPSPSHGLEIALFGAGAAVVAASSILMAVEANNGAAAANRHDRTAYDGAKAAWIAGLAGNVLGGGLALSGILLYARSSRPGSRYPASVGVRATLTQWRLECAW